MNVTARIRLKTVDSSVNIDDVSLVLTSSLGVDDFSDTNKIELFPNPVKDILSIKSLSIIKKVEVFNVLGQKVMGRENTNDLNVTKLKSGAYILKNC